MFQPIIADLQIQYMDIAILTLLITAVLCLLIAGLIGTFLPVIPGPPLSWAGMLVAYLSFPPHISSTTLWIMLALTILVQVLDYLAPVWMTKAGGGSKAATTGSTVGLILGLFLAPWGLIFGPMIGAFAGEWIHTNQVGQAIRVALLSFVSFLLTTGLKFVVCGLITFYTIPAIWHRLF